jgi:hypothetical protein
MLADRAARITRAKRPKNVLGEILKRDIRAALLGP